MIASKCILYRQVFLEIGGLEKEWLYRTVFREIGESITIIVM